MFLPLLQEVEDTCSGNQLVFGDDKIWFIFPPSAYKRIIKLVKEILAGYGTHCSNATRHKTILLPIQTLIDNNIPFTRIRQRLGDLVVVAPRAYHTGYNVAPNLAIAVNFLPRTPYITDDLKHFKNIIYCDCLEVWNLRLLEGYSAFVSCKRDKDGVWRSETGEVCKFPFIQPETSGPRRSVQEKRPKELDVKIEQPVDNDGSGCARYSLRERRELMSFPIQQSNDQPESTTNRLLFSRQNTELPTQSG